MNIQIRIKPSKYEEIILYFLNIKRKCVKNKTLKKIDQTKLSGTVWFENILSFIALSHIKQIGSSTTMQYVLNLVSTTEYKIKRSLQKNSQNSKFMSCNSK